ncbi:MAG: helix-turn-helix transcriptional regulator [Chitinophagales bacterium]
MGRRKIPAPLPPGTVNSVGAANVLGISQATFFRYRKEADFPKPVQEGNRGRPALYRVDDLLEWKAMREAGAQPEH